MEEINSDQSSASIKPVSPMGVAYKWGLIAVAYLIVKTYAVYLNFGDQYTPQKGGFLLGLLDLAVCMFAFIMANKEYRDKYNGKFMTFGQGFKTSFLTGMVIIIIFSVFMFAFFSFQIDFDQMTSVAIDDAIAMMKKYGLSEEEIQKSLEKNNKFNTINGSVGMTALVYLILFSVFSLISAVITKRIPKSE